ncbi:hypothetical protein SynRCC2555_00263 [Synechococcus sp. WH 8101]|nr:hypothetical protein SynRCC2555_00263 [Synechococcus sp. WH 8101]
MQIESGSHGADGCGESVVQPAQISPRAATASPTDCCVHWFRCLWVSWRSHVHRQPARARPRDSLHTPIRTALGSAADLQASARVPRRPIRSSPTSGGLAHARQAARSRSSSAFLQNELRIRE